MNDEVLRIEDIPETVTVCCPLKSFKQRYLCKGCLNGCVHYEGIAVLTEADELDVKTPVTGEVVGKRSIQWHEKFMIKCAYPMTRRCSDMSVVED